MDAPSEVEPPPCHSQFSVAADGRHYYWRGSNIIAVLDPSTELWNLLPTTGPIPHGKSGGCSVCVGGFMYTFGGYVGGDVDVDVDGFSYTNDMSKLGLDTLQWTEIQSSGSPPMKKFASGLVCVNERTLCCFGGFGIGPTQPKSSLCDWTNELHFFDTENGVWSSPKIKGEKPSPCAGFTFTKVDQHRAVLFGGRHLDRNLRVNDVYLFNFKNMEVTKVEPVQGDSWPGEMSYHAACCLNYGQDHPQLLVHGGLDNDNKTLGDMWILDLDTRKWTEVTLPESMTPRFHHSVTATSMGPGLTEVLMFGGCRAGDIIAETTILRFELTGPSVSVAGRSAGKWALVDVAHNNTRGSAQRLSEKRIRQATAHASSVSETSDHSSQDQKMQQQQLQKKKIFDNALRDGIVTVNITNALIQGEAGVGKTCTKRILCDQGRLSTRDSTPLADISVHVRDVTDVKVHSHNNKWKEVNNEKLQEIVGAMISGIVEIQAKYPTETIIEDPVDKQLTLPVDDTNETATPARLAIETSPTLLPPASLATLSVDDANETSATLLPPAELESLDKQLTDETSATFLPLAKFESLIDDLRDKVVDSRHPRDSREILGSNWIYIIDSGGQPHFHNLLPHFVHGISIALFTLKLSEQLDSRSIVEYYENGQLISTPYRSPLTTIDTLKCLVRSMQSHTIDGEKPTLVIVGTFRDKMENISETLQEKNEQLLKILSPEFTDQLVFCNEAEDELIFSLNAKDPGAHEETIAEMIRSVVEDSPSKVIEMPVWWYVLEISLKEMSNRLNRKVLSKQECLEVAKQINIKEDALVEALKFFHEQHIFHYYVDILPNVVFTSPQVLLDKLTELVKEAYDKRIKSTATTGRAQVTKGKVMKGKWQKFRNKGIITLEFVEYFSEHFVKGVFSPPDLLKIFMNCLILTPFSPTDSEIDFTSRTAQYFMPSLLDMLAQDKLMEYRVVPFLVSPLLIRFSNGWPRAGLFCCLQVYLICQLSWKLLLNMGKPKLIAQNCVMLSPPDSSCRVTLIDSFSYIEVHVDGGEDACFAVCPTICNQIDNGIHASCQILRYSEEQLQLAFFCPCTLSSPPYCADAKEVPRFHAAVLLKDGNLRCTVDETITSRIKSKQMIWFQNTAPGSSVLQRLMVKYQIQVDREIQQIDIPYLAASFDSVEVYVDAMELSSGEQSDVRKMESNHIAMIRCLNIWKSKKLSQATFRALLEMLVQLKKEAIADHVCQYLKGMSTASIGEQHTIDQASFSHATKVYALLSSNGLTYKDGNRECRDEHICGISLQMENWELIATLLGLTPAEIEAIKYDNQSIKMMRYNSLKKWKSKALLSGTATYRVLLQALLDCGCNDQAKQACSLLKESLL